MPTFNVTLNKDAPAEKLDAAKKQAVDQGGKIVNEFTLIKGFTVEMPADSVSALSSNEHVTVEADSEVKTQ
ncbi:hypothetical protein CC78DRAFT_615454 [Lojkania enalia]|uniref:Inhibitor I9 domain-containing protein n=1 Tax=Lojkania enalia TaxID=147567 RepID=A0A9P4KC19_9PLEO|nr:hypothetical protein CC78DRAFT_615454 [Didymosphaeria enalia]